MEDATGEPLLQEICERIFDKKGFNIVTLDVRGISSMNDYFIVAEGTVERHVKALATNVMDLLREKNRKPIHIEGNREGDWVVLDYGDVIVHFFIPDLREKYALEQVWTKGKIVELLFLKDLSLQNEDSKTRNS